MQSKFQKEGNIKKNFVTVIAGFTVLSVLCSPLLGADFAPIFPKQGALVISPPNFTWATGDYDRFCLLLFLPLPDRYRLIPVWKYKKPYFLIPEAAWGSVTMNGWCFWLVFGRNTDTRDWAIIPLQYFRKVDDCVVEFPDPNLESSIREEINKPEGDIMASDLQMTTYLSLSDRNISDISGLDYLVGLDTLFLEFDPISDISPLAGLTNLNRLTLVENQISDISPLAGLTNLTELCIFDNQISDVNPLTNLTNLNQLNLAYNKISDISPLSSLINLYGSDLNSNQISDISPLTNLINFHYLRLDNNQISDINPIASLTNLLYIGLSNNQISDISPLSYLPNLVSLSLEKNQIIDIYPLVNNSGINSGDWVWLNDNPLSSTSCNDYIPELMERGVTVYHDCP
ncbi:MAG: leucine-rich repeat domain-containing protein [Deltaproteobacteria bacterium]|nr:MAG: leucine-rich repeat domain-containing protein [Deltaproteobacteria bacterium]